MAASSDAFKSFKSVGPVVFVDSKKDSPNDIPKEFWTLRKQSHMGNTIPMVMVLTADLSKGLKGVNHDSLADASKAARSLKRELKDLDVVGNAPATVEAKEPEESNLLAEEQRWTNAEGKAIQAAILSADATTVIFLMPNGKSVGYPMSQLSAASQEAVQDLLD